MMRIDLNVMVSFSRNVALSGRYSHLMWFENERCYRFESFMFSVRYNFRQIGLIFR